MAWIKLKEVVEPVNKTNKQMDQETVDLLNEVTKQINTATQSLTGVQNMANANNMNLTYFQNNYQYAVSNTSQAVSGTHDTVPKEVAPSPYIDMEKEIYKNEFEECGNVEICDPSESQHGRLENGIYYPGSKGAVSIGLIDSVSEDEDDLYAKFEDGEIVPFKGHPEEYSVDIVTWNDFKRSDLVGSEIRKAATCNIMINGKLARIIEGTDVQDLLMKADRAIDELKTMPFSICRNGNNLIGREIYYDNQPAAIHHIDEVRNLIYIVPDTQQIPNFLPPVHAIEDDAGDEWITNFGQGMYVRDYDEKIWWWRNNKVASVDPKDDPFYKQFPHPVGGSGIVPNYPPQIGMYTPNGGGTTITAPGCGGIYTTPGVTTINPNNVWTVPYITTAASPYTVDTNGTTITWTLDTTMSAGDTLTVVPEIVTTPTPKDLKELVSKNLDEITIQNRLANRKKSYFKKTKYNHKMNNQEDKDEDI